MTKNLLHSRQCRTYWHVGTFSLEMLGKAPAFEYYQLSFKLLSLSL
jgi:hypothetical protein